MEVAFAQRDDDPSSRRVRPDGPDDKRIANPRSDPRTRQLHIGVLAQAGDF
jgi:hypothetical protein